MTFTKQKLTGSTDGKGIKIATNATPGTLIHQAVAGVNDYDEVWLYVVNSNTTSLKVTLEWGGTTAPDDIIEQTIPGESGLFCIAPGLLLQNGQSIRAFGGSANLCVIHGFVNRITAV